MARGTAALLRAVCLYKEKVLPLTRRVPGYEVCPVDTLVEKSLGQEVPRRAEV